MDSVKILEPETATSLQSWPKVDRRRPGRADAANPALVPLLRGKIDGGSEAETLYGDPDQLRAVNGLAIGVVFSVTLWAAAAYIAALFVG